MSSAFEGLPKTPNLKLNKPGYDNVADIEALNENADILDAEIQGIKNTFVKSVNGINAGDGGNVDLGIMPISQGGTGATTAENARKNLGANDFVTGLSVSGRTITYKKKDGTSGTITTQDTNTTYSTATQSANGLMSASDKKKLDGIATSANAYSLPTASASVLGGVKVGSGLSISSGVLSSINAIGNNYIRFQSGVQICWGNTEITGDNNATSTVTLPIAFKDTNYSVTGTGSFGNFVSDRAFGLVTIPTITTSNFTCKKLFGEKSTFRWVAIGYWK